MKRIIGGMMAVILAFSLVACDKSEDSKNSSKANTDSSLAQVEGLLSDGTYTSEFGYTVKLPVGWSKVTTASAKEAFTDKLGNSSLSFHSGPTDDLFKAADEEYFKKDYFARMGDSVEFVSYDEIELNGNKGHKVVFTSKSDGVVTYLTQLLISVGEEIYIFTFTDVEGESQETIDAVITSLAING